AGRYRFIGSPAGEHQVVVADPEGYVAIGSSRRTVTLQQFGVVQGLDVGYHHGARISGLAFLDDGSGPATPNDGVPGGDEAGLPGVTVTAAHAAGIATATTGPDGSYELFVAAGPVTLAHDAPPATGRSDGTPTVLADTGVPDLMALTATGGAEYRYEFGAVHASALTPTQTRGQVATPGSRSYTLAYRPGTEGQVTFGLTPGRLTYRLFLDATCL